MRFRLSFQMLLIVMALAWIGSSEVQLRAEDAAAENARAELTCKEPIYSFGTRDNMDSVDHTFVITNTGNAPLVISKVKPTCGCTVANLTTDHIAPGEQALLTATLSLKGHKGKMEKSIILQSNDPIKPSLVVWFKGEATATILFAPQTAYFASVTAQSDAERTIDLIVDEKARFNILKVTNTNPHVQVKQETRKGGTFYQFHIKLVPPLEIGVLRDVVTITTDSERYPQLTIPVSAKVVDELAITPERIVLPSESKVPLVRYVLMSPGSIDKFKIESVQVPDGSGIKAEIMPLPKNGYRIRLTGIHPDAKLNGQMITIITDIPTKTRIELPIEVSDK